MAWALASGCGSRLRLRCVLGLVDVFLYEVHKFLGKGSYRKHSVDTEGLERLNVFLGDGAAEQQQHVAQQLAVLKSAREVGTLAACERRKER